MASLFTAQAEHQKDCRREGKRSGPNWTEDGDYIIGKGRTPTATRWQPGQSGNPRGPKKKEQVDPLTAFEQQVLAPFTMRVNGQNETIDLGTFSLTLMKKEAAKGSIKAQETLLKIFREMLARNTQRDHAPEVDAWEQQIVDELLREMNLPAKPVVRMTRGKNEEGELQ